MTNDILIKVEELTRYYGVQTGARPAVDNISFEVRRGEVLGFLGPNGAGKSTTMRMITGNLSPSHGRITINGIDILDQPKKAKADIGFLPELPPLYRELTVDEYLQFCARLNRISRDKQTNAIGTAKERCGLSDVGKRLIANLSKGYQQRVGIAQAIIHSPAVVVLDEPTVGLDPIQIREIRHLIRELSNEHSVILSTHILPEVQATCDRVQIINQGRLVLSDSIEGLIQRMQTSSLRLRTKNQINNNILLAIEGVVAVSVIDEDCVQIKHKPETNPAASIAKITVEQGWELLELTPDRRSLEEIFVDITTAEHTADEQIEKTEAAA
ncbi:MAG: ABC transporter ATP-binding protein [Gammaproteobacteria bacterium]|nr:ABC transporter ATP-binding protein [Gammaproteobacteria bacterium]MCF6259735.1 ABC transporter ATP-binding protein [Gammaproteobacteria bacterium]